MPMPVTGQSCGPCLQSPPVHDGVRACVAYGDVARTVALKLKYSRQLGAAKVIAHLLGRHMAELEDAILVPVPLHRWRIWSRGFNQSHAIATGLADTHGNLIIPDALTRTVKTPSLGGLGARARAKALKGAIQITARHAPAIQGKTIALVDDVYTSGATANACAKALKRAGADRVIILCWARVLGEGDGG